MNAFPVITRRKDRCVPVAPRGNGAFILRSGRKGFTLVEVAMALGIFAFAIIPIIGLMGVALTVSKDSVDSTVMSQIYRACEAYALATPDVSLSPQYFSNYGDQIKGATPATNPDALYQANFTKVSPTDAAQGLLARRVLKVDVVRAGATGNVLSTRVLQLSKDPVDL